MIEKLKENPWGLLGNNEITQITDKINEIIEVINSLPPSA